jgi:hypothetical protein
MSCNTLTNIGLFLDIIGVLFLFKYGLPSNISQTGSVNLILEQTNENEIHKWKKYNRMSRVGLLFILIGFVLQILSNLSFLCSKAVI